MRPKAPKKTTKTTRIVKSTAVLRDREYLDWLRTQPCILTGQLGHDAETVDPAHIGTSGKGIKSPDNEALPVIHSLHLEAHNTGEVSMFRKHLPDWLLRDMLRAYAREMYQDYLMTSDAAVLRLLEDTKADRAKAKQRALQKLEDDNAI